MSKIQEIFHQRLPEIWEDYEPRPTQIQLSESISDTINQSGSLITEAGTGVGKSLSYLIPAALYSLESGQTVVISTETKALQDQLLKKDIPLVQKIIEQEIKAEIALGASNYICKRKWKNLKDGIMNDFDLTNQSEELDFWINHSEIGIRTEYKGTLRNDSWAKITRESDNCLGRNCKNYSHSFYFLAKEKWKRANLLIVNHSLLASHIAGEFKILPDFTKLIIDEAHNFPEILGKSFRSEVTYDSVLKILGFIYTKDNKNTIFSKVTFSLKFLQTIEEAKLKLSQLFNSISSELGLQFQGATRIRKKLILDSGMFEESLRSIVQILEEKSTQFKKDSDIQEEKEIALALELSSSRLSAVSDFLAGFRKGTNEKIVYWCEPPGYQSSDRFLRLYSEPIQIDEIISEKLVPRLDAIIYTSATIKTAGSGFSFFENQLGYQSSEKKEFESPFQYSKNSLLYIPKTISDPSFEADYLRDILEEIVYLIQLTKGNTFVLFTSHKSMQYIYENLRSKISFPLISQGILGAVEAKNQYMATDNAVLLGVSSFWQGVDIRGEKLKNVIISKLPFQPPNDPVLETKMEILKSQNKNPFMEIQLPRASLLLKQGFGRLIRSQTDTGIVSILDPRIHTKYYGKILLESFPKGLRPILTREDLLHKFQNLPIYQTR